MRSEAEAEELLYKSVKSFEEKCGKLCGRKESAILQSFAPSKGCDDQIVAYDASVSVSDVLVKLYFGVTVGGRTGC